MAKNINIRDPQCACPVSIMAPREQLSSLVTMFLRFLYIITQLKKKTEQQKQQRRIKLREEILRMKKRRLRRLKNHRLEMHKMFKIMQILFFSCAASTMGLTRDRTIWVRERSTYWWQHTVNNTFTGAEWYQNFRMHKTTFEYLCRELEPVLERSQTRLRKPLSVKQRVAVTLWRLSSSVPYRTLSWLFGIGQSTACEIVIETCDAIVAVLKNRCIRFPKGMYKPIATGYI